MRIHTSNYVCHAGQDHDVPDSSRGLYTRQNQRLRLHAACIANDWNDRFERNSLCFDTRLCQYCLMAVPPGSRGIGATSEPWLHLLRMQRQGKNRVPDYDKQVSSHRIPLVHLNSCRTWEWVKGGYCPVWRTVMDVKSVKRPLPLRPLRGVGISY